MPDFLNTNYTDNNIHITPDYTTVTAPQGVQRPIPKTNPLLDLPPMPDWMGKSFFSMPVRTRLDKTLRFTDPELGYNPTDNRLEFKYADAHPGQNFKHNVLQFGARLLGGAAEGISTIPIVVNAAVNGEFSKMYDNATTNTITNWLDSLNNSLPVYKTEYETNHPVAKYFNPFSGSMLNAWGGAINNLGYTAGAIIGSLATDAAITFVTGGVGTLPAMAAQAARLMTAIGRGAKMFVSAPKVAAQVIRNVHRGEQLFAGLRAGRAATSVLDDAAVAGLSVVDDAAVAGVRTEGSAIARGIDDAESLIHTRPTANILTDGAMTYYKIRDAIKYNLVLTTSAAAEGAFEANEVYRLGKEELIQEYRDAFGKDPNSQELADIDYNAKTAGNYTMGANIALLYLSNRLNWGSLFKSTNRALSEGVDQSITGWGKNIARTTIKGQIKEVEKGVSRMVYEISKAPATRMGKVLLHGEKVARIGSKGIVEGLEEASQYTVAEASVDYIKDKYDPHNIKNVTSYMKSFNIGLGKAFGTNEGWDNIMGGFIGGMLGGGAMGLFAKRGQKSKLDQMIHTAKILTENPLTGPHHFKFNEATVQLASGQEHKKAIDAGDVNKAKNIKSDMNYTWASTGVKINSFDKRMEELDMAGELEGTSFSSYWGAEDTQENREIVNSFITQTKIEAANTKKHVEAVQKLVPNSHKRGTPEWNNVEQYKDKLSYLLSTVENRQSRLKTISKDLSNLAPLLRVNDAVRMTSREGISHLSDQLQKASEDISQQLSITLDPDTQVAKDLRTTQNSLNALNDRLQTILGTEAIENVDSEFKGGEFVSVMQDLFDVMDGIDYSNNSYINRQLALENGTATTAAMLGETNINGDALAETLEKLQDVHKLNRDITQMNQLYEYLRTGKGEITFMKTLSQILADAQKTVDDEGNIVTDEDIEDNIRQNAYEEVFPPEDFIIGEGEEAVLDTERRDKIIELAKKTVKGEELTKEEKDFVDPFLNESNAIYYDQVVKAEEQIAQELEDHKPPSPPKDISIHTESDNHFQTSPNPLFFNLYPNSTFLKSAKNFYDAVFNTPLSELPSTLTAKFTPREPHERYEKVPNTELHRSVFTEVIRIMSNGENLAEMRPPNTLYHVVLEENEKGEDVKVYQPISDPVTGELLLTKQQYTDLIGNDPKTYDEFKRSSELYFKAYKQLEAEMGNNNNEATPEMLSALFDIKTNPGVAVYNTDSTEDAAFSDVSISNKAVIKLFVTDDTIAFQVIDNTDSLTDAELSNLETAVETNKDVQKVLMGLTSSKHEFIYVAVFPIGGKIANNSFVRARLMDDAGSATVENFKISSTKDVFASYAIRFVPKSAKKEQAVATNPIADIHKEHAKKAASLEAERSASLSVLEKEKENLAKRNPTVTGKNRVRIGKDRRIDFKGVSSGILHFNQGYDSRVTFLVDDDIKENYIRDKSHHDNPLFAHPLKTIAKQFAQKGEDVIIDLRDFTIPLTAASIGGRTRPYMSFDVVDSIANELTTDYSANTEQVTPEVARINNEMNLVNSNIDKLQDLNDKHRNDQLSKITKDDDFINSEIKRIDADITFIKTAYGNIVASNEKKKNEDLAIIDNNDNLSEYEKEEKREVVIDRFVEQAAKLKHDYVTDIAKFEKEKRNVKKKKSSTSTSAKPLMASKKLRSIKELSAWLQRGDTFNLSNEEADATAKMFNAVGQAWVKRKNTSLAKGEKPITISDFYNHLSFGNIALFNYLYESDVNIQNSPELLAQLVGEVSVSKLSNAKEILFNLERAKMMQGANIYTPNQIWETTGWTYDTADKKWKYELKEYIGEVNDESLTRLKEKDTTVTVKDMVDSNADIFVSFPQLLDMSVLPISDVNGAFESSTNTIYINPDLTKEQVRLTLIHEIQHFVQKEEGFLKGGNVNYFKKSFIDSLSTSPQYKKFEREVKQLEKLYSKDSEEYDSAVRELAEKHGDFIKFASDILIGAKTADPMQLYSLLAGEQESRNVEYRADMTAEERSKQYPGLTEQVSEEEQIRLMDDLVEFGKSDSVNPNILVTQKYFGITPKYNNSGFFIGFVTTKEEKVSQALVDRINEVSKQKGWQVEASIRPDTGNINLKNTASDTGVTQGRLFQGDQAKPKGVYDKMNRVIFSMTNPDVTTFPHEIAHFWEEMLTEEERNTIYEWAASSEFTEDMTQEEKDAVVESKKSLGWTREMSETFAKGFEVFLAEEKGVVDETTVFAHTPEMQSVFTKFAEWLVDVLQDLKNALGIELNTPMRTIYSAMVNSDSLTIDVRNAAAELLESVEVADTTEERGVDQEDILITPEVVSGNEATLEETVLSESVISDKELEKAKFKKPRRTKPKPKYKIGDVVISDGKTHIIEEVSVKTEDSGVHTVVYTTNIENSLYEGLISRKAPRTPVNKGLDKKKQYERYEKIVDKIIGAFQNIFMDQIQFEVGSFDFPARARFHKGKIYINLDYISEHGGDFGEIISHELMHPFVKALSITNKKLYDGLIKELNTNHKDIVDTVKSNPMYSEYVMDEALSIYLGKELAKAFNKDGSVNKEYVESRSLLKKFMVWLNKMVDVLLGRRTEENLKDFVNAANNPNLTTFAKTATVALEKLYSKHKELSDILGGVTDVTKLSNEQINKIKDPKLNAKVDDIISDYINSVDSVSSDFKFVINPKADADVSFKTDDKTGATVVTIKESVGRKSNFGKIILSAAKAYYSKNPDKYGEFEETINSNLYSSTNEVYVSDLKSSMKLQDISDFILLPLNNPITSKDGVEIGELKIKFTGDEIDAIDELDAYFNIDPTTAKNTRDAIMRKMSDLEKAAKKEIRSTTLQHEHTKLFFLNKDITDDQLFVEQYMEYAAVALGLHYSKYVQLVTDLKNGVGTFSQSTLNHMQKEMATVTTLISFYSDAQQLVKSKMYDTTTTAGMKEYVKYLKASSYIALIKDGTENFAIHSTVEWLFPLMEIHNKAMIDQGYTGDEYLMTREKLYAHFKYGAGKECDWITYWLSTNVGSRNPVNALVANTISDNISRTNVNSVNSGTDIGIAFQKWLKDRGLGVTDIKAQTELYKKEFMVEVEHYHQTYNPDTKDYDGVYIKKWAIHTKFRQDLFEKDLRILTNRYDIRKAKNTAEADKWNEIIQRWKDKQGYKMNYATGEVSFTNSKYVNTEYDTIKNDEYFKVIEKNYHESNNKYGENRLQFGIVPQEYTSGFLSTWKDLVGEVKTADNIKQKFEVVKGMVQKSLIATQQTQHETLDGVAYKAIHSTLSDIKDEQHINLNLHETVTNYVIDANRYASLKDTEFNVRTLIQLLKGNEVLGIKPRSFSKLDVGAKITSDNQMKDAKAIFAKLDKAKQEGKSYDVAMYSELEKKIADGVQKRSFGDIITGKNMPSEGRRYNDMLLRQLNSVYYGDRVNDVNIESMGNISVSKLAGIFSFYVSGIGMMGNVTAAVNNITIGNMQMLIEAHGGQYYTKLELAKANGGYISNIPNFLGDLYHPVKSKDTQLGMMYDAIQGEIEDGFGNYVTGNIIQKMFRKNTLFFMTSLGEHQLQMTNMRAMMIGKKVTLKSGEKISLYDAYVTDADGRISLSSEVVDFKQQDIDKFTRELHSVNRALNGNYSKFNKTMLQYEWYGELVVKFRKYLYPSFVARWGEERIDYERNTMQVGYLRYFLGDYVPNAFRALLHAQMPENIDKLLPHQRIAVRKSLFDLSAFVALTALGIGFLAAVGSGDDEKKELTTGEKFTLLSIMRLRSDLGMFHINAPMSLIEQIQHPSAGFTTINNFIKFSMQLADPSAVYKTSGPGYTKGDSKLWYAGKKVLPFVQFKELAEDMISVEGGPSQFEGRINQQLGYMPYVKDEIKGVTPRKVPMF